MKDILLTVVSIDKADYEDFKHILSPVSFQSNLFSFSFLFVW